MRNLKLYFMLCWQTFDDDLFCVSVAEDEGQTEITAEEMEISTRSKGNYILYKFVLKSIWRVNLLIFLDVLLIYRKDMKYITTYLTMFSSFNCVGAGKLWSVISCVIFVLFPGLCKLWPFSVVSDTGSTERMTQKRKIPSPSHSSNGHSSAETSPCPVKKKKKPGALSSSKDQVTITKNRI